MSRKYGMKEFKKDMAKEKKYSAGFMICLTIGLFLCAIVFSIVGESQGYDKGYADATKDLVKEETYSLFMGLEYEKSKTFFKQHVMGKIITHWKGLMIFLAIIIIVGRIKFCFGSCRE